MNSKRTLALMEKRIIPLERPIDDEYVTAKIQQLLALSDSSNADITLFINNPGGTVTACFALFDTIRWCGCDVNTVCCRGAAGYAALLLAAGSRGKRFAFQDSVIIPSLCTCRRAPDFVYSDEAADRSATIGKTVRLMAGLTGHSLDTMRAACTAEHLLSADEAKRLGLIDRVVPRDAREKGFLAWLRRPDYLALFDAVQQAKVIPLPRREEEPPSKPDAGEK